jgi:TPR repeat protein
MKRAGRLLILALLTACAPQPLPVTIIEAPTAKVSKDADLNAKAEKGDATAQYIIGERLCCANPAEHRADTRVRNKEATAWLCASARQGLSAAQYKLGQIYSGDLFNIPSLDDYRPRGKDDVCRSFALALMWYELAAEKQHAEAMGDAIRLKTRMSEKEIAASHQFHGDWKNAPCLWGEVFP